MTENGQVVKNTPVVNIADSIRLYFTYPLPDGTEYGYTFLEFGAVGCAPCKKMEKEMETIRKDFAGKVNVRFINLLKKWNKDWADYFEIQTIPTQVVLDSQGKEIYRHVGYIPADELKRYSSNILSKTNKNRINESIDSLYGKQLPQPDGSRLLTVI